MKIMVVGDVHGYWSFLNKLINRHNPDIILQCGDFGYWPKFHNTDVITENPLKRNQEPWNLYGIKSKNTKIYWCDGNHEDHFELKKFTEPTCIYDNVWYMPRGSYMTLPDGRNVLFMGGADSIDKMYRTIGCDWFPEEVISTRDIYNLPDVPIDIVISHTCPISFNSQIEEKFGNFFFSSSQFIDPSQHALSTVLEKYNPSLWYFGHFHGYATNTYKNTKWYMLNKLNNDNAWRILE